MLQSDVHDAPSSPLSLSGSVWCGKEERDREEVPYVGGRSGRDSGDVGGGVGVWFLPLSSTRFNAEEDPTEECLDDDD